MSEADFLKLVPNGWLRRLCDGWLTMHMEMPLQFVVLCGMTVIGNLVGYRVWCQKAGDAFVYPNLNAMLLSPAGESRRGGGTKTVISIARMAGAELMEGKGTREGIIEQLLETPNLLLYEEEMSELINTRDYQRSIVHFLCKLLLSDPKPFDERSRARGRVTIDKPMLSCIVTGAPDWFKIMPSESAEGGFLSRFIICHNEGMERPYINLNDETDGGAIKSALASDLHRCANGLVGRLRADEATQRWVETHYTGNLKALHGAQHKWERPHLARKTDNVLRMAMILTVAAEERELNVGRLEQAQALYDYYEATMGVFQDVLQSGADKGHAVESAVGQVLVLHGGTIGHAALVAAVRRRAHVSVKVMKEVLEGMVEEGRVERVNGPMGKVWPPVGWRVKESK